MADTFTYDVLDIFPERTVESISCFIVQQIVRLFFLGQMSVVFYLGIPCTTDVKLSVKPAFDSDQESPTLCDKRFLRPGNDFFFLNAF